MRIQVSTGLLAAVLLTLPAHAALAQDAKAGEAVFNQCESCHSADGSLGVGPSLKGVVGRQAGSVANFDYSPAMKAAARTWDKTTLDAFIADPAKAVPGNAMPFYGVPEAKNRADLLAYLETLK